ncbi:hypothetical protein G6O67_008661 [Ophiocordyceps sinensis]|uniref:Transcription initiation factor TFIID subunit 8 n=2 Tax=Ophiocordyceps sinensis TaxID=72228 RepID=A0A8H4LS25_9HYPO|nr:bromodomain associated protein [Ophiocordyceps sinensis CO18]KAF4504042.1 hypothetical protein G6O67_008661 [Ophiocordyceps sinensis]
MSPKRTLSPQDSLESEPKRPRVPSESRGVPPQHATTQSKVDDELDDETAAVESLTPTYRHLARCGIQRSIALVLKHDGFSSSTPEAMESFTSLVESYLESIIQETKRVALAARREHPISTDFEVMLRYHNLSTSSLKPHLKNPIAREELTPKYTNIVATDPDALRMLPLLSSELSGQADKDAKQFIPTSFPDFPSRHTYVCTLQEDTGSRDSHKIREEAARTAQQGEDALRRLVRASKMRKQKEVKSLVERDAQGKERFRLWETTMRRFMGTDGRGDNASLVDIADHSMIVNGDAVFSRKEVPRPGKRSAGLSVNGT